MSTKRKILFLICFVIIIAIIFIGYIFVDSNYQEKRLRKEINQLSLLDLKKDKFNKNFVSNGDYRLVEESIKNYLNDYATNLQNIDTIVTNERFSKLLSYENLSKEDDFTEAIQYVIDNKVDFNQHINFLIDMCNDEKIKDNIEKYHLKDNYVELYNELMFNNELINKIKSSKDYLEEYQEKMNLKFDASLETLDFLKNNIGNFVLEDNEIKFSTQELMNQYNNYIQIIRD